MGKDKKEHKHKHKSKKEKHEKKKRRADSSSDSGSDSGSESDSLERKRAKAERMAKKLSARLQKGGTVAGYSNESNPFGDANLTQRFVWHKKLEKQIMEGVDPKELGLKAERQRQLEREAEIEKVKRRREEREQEKVQQEEEKEQLERERALADAVDLEKKEEEFHLRQARVRASLRIAHGRSRPIDLLAANLSFFAARTEAASAPPGSDAAKAVPRFNARLEPESLTDGLSAAELAELETDVSALAQLDTEEPENAEFWENMTLICAWERAQATRREQADRAASRGLPPPPSMEHGLHASLDDDVASMFAGKPHVELLALREQIADSLASGAAAEPEYWQAVLRRCEVWLARARVRDIHSALRARALAVTGGAAELDVRAAMRWDEEEQGAAAGVGGPTAAEEEEADDSAVEEPQEGPPEAAVAASDGRFSPVRMAFVAREDGSLEVVEAEADAAQLAALRAAVRARLAPALAGAAAAAVRAQGPGEGDAAFRAHAAAAGGAGPSGGAAAFTANISLSVADAAAEESKARELRAVAARAMGDDEEGAEVQFSGEVEVESQVYWWHDKYRPRKPKYFNRVHTGYEWNKYNQTHYDHDNPPPKVVQGYKFNIFYPDLIDKTKGPTYTVIPDGSAHGETCLLRFHAGPPYEDIAFRVVNKEWEYAHRRGFKCVFERGILHLYINFVRPRYRR